MPLEYFPSFHEAHVSVGRDGSQRLEYLLVWHRRFVGCWNLVCAAMLSNRRIASDFGLTERAIRAHKANHVSQRLIAAVERKQERLDDKFMQRHEDLYSEARRVVDEAKGAVKMQKVTVERPLLNPLHQPILQAVLVDGQPVYDADGKPLMRAVMTTVDEYREFRDIGVMAPALTVAANLNRVLGEATGRFSKEVHNEDRKPFVIILKADTVAIPSHATDNSSHPVAMIDASTIDVKALGD